MLGLKLNHINQRGYWDGFFFNEMTVHNIYQQPVSIYFLLWGLSAMTGLYVLQGVAHLTDVIIHWVEGVNGLAYCMAERKTLENYFQGFSNATLENYFQGCQMQQKQHSIWYRWLSARLH